jgi:hypothetical protein
MEGRRLRQRSKQSEAFGEAALPLCAAASADYLVIVPEEHDVW